MLTTTAVTRVPIWRRCGRLSFEVWRCQSGLAGDDDVDLSHWLNVIEDSTVSDWRGVA